MVLAWLIWGGKIGILDLLQTIVHQQQGILNELRIISSASQKSAEQARRKSRVNELAAMVLAQNSYRSWTAAAVGREG